MATPEAAIRLVISADNLAGPAIDGLNKALASIAKSLERITGTGKGAAGELAKVGDESGPADALAKALAKADRALAGISGEGKAADTALAKMGASADKAATGVAKVDESIAKIKTESGAADSGLSKMSGELDRVAAAGDRTAAALDKEALAAAKAGGAGLAGGAEAAAGTAATGGGVGTEAQAAAAGAAAGGAGGAGGAVAETAANAELATKRWEKVGKAAESASRFFLTVGAAAGIAGVGAVILGSKFQQAMELIHTQAGATQAEANRMSRAILAMGGTVSQGPMQLADALYHLESVGLRGSKALDALKAAAEGAAIGGASLNDTTYALSSAVNTGIQGTQNFNEAMGMLVAIAGSGDMHMQDLAQSLSSGVLPAGKAAGLSLLDVGAALATLTDNGVPAQEAATRLRMTFSLLSAPTKQATKELASIGMSQLQLAQDMRQHGLLFALEDLKRHLTDTGLTAEQQGEIIARSFGGGKSSATIITLLDSLGRLQSKYKIIGKGAKDFGSDWAATQKTTAVAWGKMMSSLESMGIELGQKLMPVATRVMDAITRLAAAFGKLPPGTIKAIAGAIVGLTAVLLPLGAALFVFSKVAQLAAAMEAFGVATGIALGPIALIGIALVALGVIVLEVITHWKQITDWMRKNVPGAFKVATEVVRVLGATFHTAFTAIARLISRVWIEVQSWTKQHWSEIEAVLRVVFDVLKTLITVQFDLYAGIVKGRHQAHDARRLGHHQGHDQAGGRYRHRRAWRLLRPGHRSLVAGVDRLPRPRAQRVERHPDHHHGCDRRHQGAAGGHHRRDRRPDLGGAEGGRGGGLRGQQHDGDAQYGEEGRQGAKTGGWRHRLRPHAGPGRRERPRSGDSARGQSSQYRCDRTAQRRRGRGGQHRYQHHGRCGRPQDAGADGGDRDQPDGQAHHPRRLGDLSGRQPILHRGAATHVRGEGRVDEHEALGARRDSKNLFGAQRNVRLQRTVLAEGSRQLDVCR